MFVVDISVRGLAAVQKRIDKIIRNIKDRKTVALSAIGKRATRRAKQFAPYKTGTLERTIRYRMSGDQVMIFVPMGSKA